MTIDGMVYCSCKGNPSCYKCDGKGWLTSDEQSGLAATWLKVPKSNPISPQVSESAPSTPTFKRAIRTINLAANLSPTSKRSNAEMLSLANIEIANAEAAMSLSPTSYFNAAAAALRTIKGLLKDCKTDQMKPRLRKLLDTAFFHLKQSEALVKEGGARNTRSGKSKNADKAKWPTASKTTQTTGASEPTTSMGIRLRDLGFKRAK